MKLYWTKKKRRVFNRLTFFITQQWNGPVHFYPRPVLAFGYCHRLCLCIGPCVCVCMCQSLPCPHDKSSSVQARITKFGTEVQNILGKIPLIFGDDRPWASRSNLALNWILPNFELCPHDNLSPVLARIIKFGQERHLTTVKIPIDFGRDRHSDSISFLIVKAIFFTYLRCFLSHLVRPCRKS